MDLQQGFAFGFRLASSSLRLPIMIATSFLTATLLALAYVISFQRRRAKTSIKPNTTSIFESKIDPPYIRPVTSKLEGDILRIQAPVVHAKISSNILILDVKSDSEEHTEGFEIAITEFKPEWINSSSYKFHKSPSQLLLGPQGDITDKLLERIAQAHDIKLPECSGCYVQVFAVDGVVTDPQEFKVKMQASLPSGNTVQIAYDYASSSVTIDVDAAAFMAKENFQPLGIVINPDVRKA